MSNFPIPHRKCLCSPSWWRKEHCDLKHRCAPCLKPQVMFAKWQILWSYKVTALKCFKVTTDFFPSVAWAQSCSCCGFHFSPLFLGALKWLCCSPEAQWWWPCRDESALTLATTVFSSLVGTEISAGGVWLGRSAEAWGRYGWDGPARCGLGSDVLRWQLSFILYWNPQHGGQFCGWL